VTSVKPQATPMPAWLAPTSVKESPLTTVSDLIDAYFGSEQFRNLQYRSRSRYTKDAGRIRKDCGPVALADLKEADIWRLYDMWSSGGKTKAGAHAIITMLRILVNFGMRKFEDSECIRLAMLLGNMRFETSKPREDHLLTEDHAKAIIARAHRDNRQSV